METRPNLSRPPRLEGAGTRAAIVAAVLGALGLVAAWLLGSGDDAARQDFFRSYLVSFVYFLSLALGALVFVLVTHLTRAGWSVALRRVAEVVAWTVLPLAALAVVVLLGMHDLYEWSHADVVAADALLARKSAWLNPTFFAVRLAIYFAVWSFTAVFLLRRSLAQDASGDPRLTLQLERFAAPATIVFAVSVTCAAFDLIMSLYPHWYSTIFGVYFFAGAFLGFFALLALLLAAIGRYSELGRVVGTEHFHDVGKLMFAFVVFWAYIAFSQYMLIWYANVPEETIWYQTRQTGSWTSISLLLLFGHFLAPFLALMSRHPKRRRGALLAAATWLLVMHWCDLAYLVLPEARPDGPVLRPVDLACFVGVGGLFAAALLWRLGRVNLLPVRDPRLAESLGFENA